MVIAHGLRHRFTFPTQRSLVRVPLIPHAVAYRARVSDLHLLSICNTTRRLCVPQIACRARDSPPLSSLPSSAPSDASELPMTRRAHWTMSPHNATLPIAGVLCSVDEDSMYLAGMIVIAAMYITIYVGGCSPVRIDFPFLGLSQSVPLFGSCQNACDYFQCLCVGAISNCRCRPFNS